jgi:outer membrane assembly lipoprotein YfiO
MAVAVMTVQFSAAAQWVWTPETGRLVSEKRLPKETDELQLEYARSLYLAGEHKKALKETDKFENYYGDSELADQNQFLRGEIRLAQDRPVQASTTFQQVIDAYPETELYDTVIEQQYAIGDALYDEGVARKDKKWRMFKKKPFKQAVDVYTMVIGNQPFTDAAGEGQYKIGLCHFTREEYIEAAYNYQRVIEVYPASDYVDEAGYGLAMCYYNTSERPDYDQIPSFLAIDAIDDFRARFPTDERNTDLAEKRKEMRERIASQRLQVAGFYERRRKFEAAEIYYSVVVEQFPETEAADQAREWLSSREAERIAKQAALESEVEQAAS